MSEPANIGLGDAVHETDAALLVDLVELGEEKWIPKSVIHEDSEVFTMAPDENCGDVVVELWWAEKEGLV